MDEKKRRILIKSSDGLARNLQLLVDGKAIEAQSLRIDIEAESRVVATLRVYVDEVDIDADFETILERIPLQ